MLEELNEEEGPDLERHVRGCRPMMSGAITRQQYIAPPAKGGSATHTLRRKTGIRVCVNWKPVALADGQLA